MTNEEIYLNQLANKGKVTNNENIFGIMLLEKSQKKQEWKKRMNNLMKTKWNTKKNKKTFTN